MRLEASHVRCARECLHEKMLFKMIRIRLDVALGLFKSSVLLTNDPSLQLHARLKRKFRQVATHRHTHAAENKQDGSVGLRAHGL